MKVPTSFRNKVVHLDRQPDRSWRGMDRAAWRASLLSSRSNMTSPSTKAAYRRSRLRSILYEQHDFKVGDPVRRPPLAEIDEGYFG